MSVRPVIVIAGVGNGTGASTARVFSKQGHLDKFTSELKQAGGEARHSPSGLLVRRGHLCSRGHRSTNGHLPRKPNPRRPVERAFGAWKSFLDITEQDVHDSVDANFVAPFAFSRQIILAFQENDLNELGKRGPCSSPAPRELEGNVTTSSLSKEFGKQNIHVSLVDTHTPTGILTDRSLTRHTEPEAQKQFAENADIRLDAESIAKLPYLANQDRSAWTWELDLRPAHEKW
ncbi:uncharacterized protein B0H18DRAFT_1086363 [Fomitopsis serialis]|uniref:uncharacterized protein n=1 Tax=Fomitopsis serialis TaxID=139415 RepID=UPI002008B290|nr:uncharacterized protein B0H18DRAFT_1086363 [Neoantrodia serialis]KAH9920628.1 hypothetical protein B0H18DRAFT_1086363 [Neoantrodia serialis]